MAISVQCACGKKLKVPESVVGRLVMCPYCSDQFLVPGPAAAPAAEAPVAMPAPSPAILRPAPPLPAAPLPHARPAPPLPLPPPALAQPAPPLPAPKIVAEEIPEALPVDDDEVPPPPEALEALPAEDEEVPPPSDSRPTDELPELEARPVPPRKRTDRARGRASATERTKRSTVPVKSGGPPKGLWIALGTALAVAAVGGGAAAIIILSRAGGQTQTGRGDGDGEKSSGKALPPPGPPPLPIGPDDLPIHPGERRLRAWADLAAEVGESVVVIKTERGVGSGFLVDARGLVVTNYHVVEDSIGRKGIDIRVLHRDASRKIQPAVYKDCIPIYFDPVTDMAILEIRQAPRIPFRPAVLHRDDSYRKGEDIAVIGSPGVSGTGEQLENSYSQGPISEKEREHHGMNYIQVGATINPGNSGGPLFNQYAEVIGMATWKYTQTTYNFAVPVACFREAVLAHPFGSFDAAAEEEACRKVVDAYWKAIVEKDAETIQSSLPSSLTGPRELQKFNAYLKAFREQLDILRRSRIPEADLERMLNPGSSPAAGLLYRMVKDKPEDQEFTTEDVRDYYVQLQLLGYEEAKFKKYEINSVSLTGAVGKFNVRITYEDARGRETSQSDVKTCFKDRGDWKVFAMPPQFEEEED